MSLFTFLLLGTDQVAASGLSFHFCGVDGVLPLWCIETNLPLKALHYNNESKCIVEFLDYLCYYIGGG